MNSARERENWPSRGMHVLTYSHLLTEYTSVHQRSDGVLTDVRKHKHIQTLKERETGQERQRKLSRHDLKTKCCF